MKLSAFQLVLYGIFGLAAVIGLFVFATYTTTTKEGSIGTVTIWGTLPKAGMDSFLTTLGQTNTELRSVSYVEKDPFTLPGELATAIATGGAPDLVLDSQENLLSLARFVEAISLEDLSAATFRSAFVGGAEIFAAPDGFYGVPFLVDPLVLYANRAILSSRGIATPPATWESLTGLVPRVAVLTPNRQITRGLIALGAYDNVRNARAILSTLFLQTNVLISGYGQSGTLVADLGTGNDTGVPPGESVVTFYTQFTDPSKVSYTWNASLPDSQRAFSTTDLALYLGYLSEARFLAQSNPNLDMVVAPLPQPGTASVKVAYGRIYAFMIPRGAQNGAGAFQVAALFTNQNEQALASEATGLVPVSLANLSSLPSDPAASIGYSEALYTKGWLSPAPVNTDSIWSAMINNVTSGRSTVDTALTIAERSLSAALAQ